MLTIDRIKTNSDLVNLSTEWHKLLQNSKSDTIFLTWEWLATWWKHYQADRELMVLRIDDKDKQQLVGIAPFYFDTIKMVFGRTVRSIRFLGAGEPVCSEYLDIICREGYESAVWQTILQYFTSAYTKWDVLQLQDVASTSASIAILNTFVSDYKLKYQVRKITRCPYLLFTDFQQNAQSPFQKKILRDSRKLMKQYAVFFRKYNRLEEIEPVFTEFVTLHRKRWAQKQVPTAFDEQAFYQFQKEIAMLFSNQHWLQIYTLEIEQQIIAAEYCFEYRHKTFFYQHGFDFKWHRYSPGKLALNYAIEEGLQNQMTEFDFLRGEESYKYYWTNKSHENISFDIYPGNWTYYTYFAVINTLRKIKSIINHNRNHAHD
jgi:CelD/BcsL family acetyltransferase involved in cellulose biosynthesis